MAEANADPTLAAINALFEPDELQSVMLDSEIEDRRSGHQPCITLFAEERAEGHKRLENQVLGVRLRHVGLKVISCVAMLLEQRGHRSGSSLEAG